MWSLLLLPCLFFGRGYADASTEDIITLYSVVPSGDSFSATAQESVSATPVGTASDGSATTYSEVVVYYDSTSVFGSSSNRESVLFPTQTQIGTLVESASGYDLVLSDASAGFSAHCSLGGCVESEYAILETTISSTRTSTFTSAATTSFSNGVTIPIFTLTSNLPPSTTTPTPTQSVSIVAASPSLQHASNIHKSVIGPAVGGAVGGAAFIALLTFVLWLINRHRQKRKGLREIRELPVSTRELKPDTSSSTKGCFSGSANSATCAGVYHDSLTKTSTPQSMSLKIAEESIRAPSPSFVFPTVTSTNSAAPTTMPPPPVDPVAPPRPEPLPPQVRNRPSRFVERLSINSTDLNVLMALARTEDSRSKQKRKVDLDLELGRDVGGVAEVSVSQTHPPSPSPPPSSPRIPSSPSPPSTPPPRPSRSPCRLSPPPPSPPHSPTTSVHSRLRFPIDPDLESPATFHSFPTSTPTSNEFRVESPPPRTPRTPPYDSRSS